jgi:hypothetical protein
MICKNDICCTHLIAHTYQLYSLNLLSVKKSAGPQILFLYFAYVLFSLCKNQITTFEVNLREVLHLLEN